MVFFIIILAAAVILLALIGLNYRYRCKALLRQLDVQEERAAELEDQNRRLQQQLNKALKGNIHPDNGYGH